MKPPLAAYIRISSSYFAHNNEQKAKLKTLFCFPLTFFRRAGSSLGMKPMKPQVPPPALRAARALFGLSQQSVAELAKTSLRSVQLAEREDGAGEEVNSKLRGFYERRGVVFLGSVEISSGLISTCGVRLWDPLSDPLPEILPDNQTRADRISFAAARSFLDLSLEAVSKGSGINRQAVTALVTGADTASTEKYKKLVRYFEEQGMEFLGRRDQASQGYFGVGVRLISASSITAGYSQ